MSLDMWKKSALTIAMAATLAACGSDDDNNDKSTSTPLEQLNIACESVTQASTGISGATLELAVVDRYVSGNDFDTASAEIVSYDACSDQLFVVNSKEKTVDVLTLSSTNSAPTKKGTIDLATAATKAGIDIGAANSVSAKQGLVAVAIEAATKQDTGLIALYRSDDLSLINVYSAGALPDMVTLSDDGRYLLSANEGEPSGNYKNDPEGSVTIVDLKGGFSADQAKVTQVSFADFNTGASRAAELGADVRISGPTGTTVAQDLEPEYLALNGDASKAYVALQENNALAIIDVATGTVDSIKSLGEKSWKDSALDASNKDGVGTDKLTSYDGLVGLYMPDTIVSFEKDGKTYIVTANEGDGREYFFDATEQECTDAKGIVWDDKDGCLSHIDEAAAKDFEDFGITVADAHPLKAALDDKKQLQRLKLVIDTNNKDIAADATLQAFGGRSFSIWNASGELVYDSGDDIAERVLAADADNFNSTNDNNQSPDDRSDNKGTEPEAVEVAMIGDKIFAFVGLERQGGIMVYDITTPSAPVFQTYLNNRDFSEPVCTEVKPEDDAGECDNDTYNTAAGDLAPESIDYFSRLGKHYIAVGNEVSGTTTVYEVK